MNMNAYIIIICHSHSCCAVCSPPMSATLCCACHTSTVHTWPESAHRSPSNTSGFPAVIGRSYFELQWQIFVPGSFYSLFSCGNLVSNFGLLLTVFCESTPPACLLHSPQPEAPHSQTWSLPHSWSAPIEPFITPAPVLSLCSALGSSSYRTLYIIIVFLSMQALADCHGVS